MNLEIIRELPTAEEIKAKYPLKAGLEKIKEAIASEDEATIKQMMITSTERRKYFNKK